MKQLSNFWCPLFAIGSRLPQLLKITAACCDKNDKQPGIAAVKDVRLQLAPKLAFIRHPAKTLRLKGIQRAFQQFNVREKDQAHFILDDKPDYLQGVQFLNEALARRPRPDCSGRVF
jgi:hypothetical protein